VSVVMSLRLERRDGGPPDMGGGDLVEGGGLQELTE
jgi:hypothetical protein